MLSTWVFRAGARRRGISTSWDFGWVEDLVRDPGFAALAASLDYLFMNEKEAPLFARRRSLERAIEHWRDYVMGETLALSMAVGIEGDGAKAVEIGGAELEIQIEKA